jgi:muramoyltetrapeptide carboxypeptidase
MKAKALKKGDVIGIFAPSSYIDSKKLDEAIAYLNKRGFEVLVHPQTYDRIFQSAGTDNQKLEAFYDLLSDKSIKAIFAAGGGNFSSSLLDLIDYEFVKRHKKIIMGFSDVTAFLNAITCRTGLITFHGPVASWLPNIEKLPAKSNFELLSGERAMIDLRGSRVLRHGQAQGQIWGGNLSLFHLLPGTKTPPQTRKSILILEDIGEELSHVDRMFIHLKRVGVLNEISGLICGAFSNLKDTGTRPFGLSFDEIVMRHVEDYSYPVIVNAPFGHINNFYAMPIGAKAFIDTKGKKQLLLNEKVVL